MEGGLRLLEREALVGERLLELLLVVLEVVLLDLREPLLDVLVGDLDVRGRGGERELLLLDEELDRALAQVVVLGASRSSGIPGRAP